MKFRNSVTDAGSTSGIAVQPDIAEEQAKTAPTTDEIRQRAFEIHIERGGIWGNDLDDWLQAEHELQQRYKNNGQREKE